MKDLFIAIGLLSCFLLGCSEPKEKVEVKYQHELEKLITVDDKRNYLESIFYADQKVRGSEGSALMLKYGKGSKEYMDYVFRQIAQDSINLVKVEAYLEKFGHPDKNELGEIAAVTPWAVIHHAQTYEDRVRNFEILYKAYLAGNIDDGSFSMFLGRMYEMKNKSRFDMPSPYTAEDEINALIEALNLRREE